MNRREAELRFKLVYSKWSKDFHDIFTPFDLCDEMLDKLPTLNNDQDILVMFNLEFIYTIKERINNLDNVWLVTPCKIKAQVAEAIGVKKNHIFFYTYKDKRIIREKKMPKFDVVLGNPPYQRGLHMKFLEKAYDISKGYVVFIQPSIWLLSDDEYAKHNSIKNKIKNDVESVELINGNYIFGVGLFVPLSITFLNKNTKNNVNKSISLIDKLNNKLFQLEDLSIINKWGDYVVFPNIKEKILALTEENCKNTQNRRNMSKCYFVSISKIRGHVITDQSNKLFQTDFYSPFPENFEELNYGPVEKVNDKWVSQGQRNWYGFDTKEEALNFMNFMKTRWAMFALSLNKFNANIQEKEVESIPWLDFSQEWTEEKFEKLINASPEEIDFIHKNIPDYYNISK